MKAIRQAALAVALSVGLVSAAEAHVFVGFGIGVPMAPMVAAVPIAPVPVYAPPPPPVYYARRRLCMRRPSSLATTDTHAVGIGTTDMDTDTATGADRCVRSTC